MIVILRRFVGRVIASRIARMGGVVAFISNGAWIDGNAQEGFRKCLEGEYSSVYVLNLRGNQRTSGGVIS